MKRSKWDWVVVGAVLSAGCESPDLSSGNIQVVRDSLGVTIVENRGASDTTFVLATDLELGSVDGTGPELFTDVVKVAVNGSGDLFVADATAISVRVFDATGAFSHEFGRRGDGPGEVNNLNTFDVVRDTAIVTDWQGGGKAVRFTLDGEFVDAQRLQKSDGRYIAPMGRDRDSWLATLNPPFERPALDFGEPLEQRLFVHRYDWSTGEVGDEVYSRVSRLIYGTDSGTPRSDWGLFTRLFPGDMLDASGRLFEASTSDYTIRIIGPEGLEHIIRRDVELVPVTPETLVQVRAAAVNVMDTMTGLDPGRRRQQVEQAGERVDLRARLPHGEFVPPLGALVIGSGGEFWVSRRDGPDHATTEGESMFVRPSGIATRPVQWDIFAADGRYRGSVEVPPGVRIDEISSDHAWGVRVGDFDVPYVVRFRLVPQAEYAS